MKKDQLTEVNRFSEKPISRPIYEEMKSSYLSYAMSVIVSRALPDVRDGLKPVHRRIIYAMHKGGFDWSKQFRKSARVVGDVIGKYHPHGDQAVYDALVRMVQDFSMSLPLVEGQGNFGSVDGDPPAAMRYTESRLSKVSQHLVNEINKDTVDFKSNYDETEKEPEVLPAQYPNLLVNGAGGIAVGMATSIPPHNLGEVIDATLAVIENKDIKLNQLMKLIPGPDFPTGGIIIGKDIIKQGYKDGRGSFKIRGEISTEQIKNGRERLIISSIPYQVNKSILNERIAELVRDKKIEGINDIRDESRGIKEIRVVIDLKKGVEPETIKRQLYKYTSIESSFGFNSLAIVNKKPEPCGLKKFLECFIEFREEVITKATKFDLKKAEDRAHILIGLSVTIDNLDKIIKIIRNSSTPEDAKIKLLKSVWSIKKSGKLVNLIESKKSKTSYKFSTDQVIAILELRLQKLTALGINEIEVELKKLVALITQYKKILSSKKELYKVMSSELKEIKEKYASKRKTQIIDAVLNYNIEETIQKEAVIITVTLQGYIKRGALSSVKQQKRGGKGKAGIKTRDEDSVVQTLSVNTHTQVLFFSSEGLVYRLKAWKIPVGSSISKGKSVSNLLQWKNHQTISSIMPFPEDISEKKDYHLIFVTSNGKIRKNNLDDFSSINSAGKIAIKLDTGDKIAGVQICRNDQDIILSTKSGKSIRFESSKLRVFKGRSSKGIKGINLSENDKIVSLSIINHIKKNMKKNIDKKSAEKFILSVTENGYGKKTPHFDYRVTNRGGKGIINIVTSQRNGNVSSSFPVSAEDDIIISTDKGKVIRTSVKEIRIAGRNTQGVRIIKLSNNEKVVSAIKIDDNFI